jgi:hypothetical protein
MPLSWNEIKSRAVTFSKDWAEAANEEAEAKPFLYEFLNVFGLSQRKVSSFEHRVKKLNDADGYIDLFYKGTLLVEMKSRGKDLAKAYRQAREYLAGVAEHELPSHILICDFHTFHLYELGADAPQIFTLPELVKNVKHFGFLIGYQTSTFKEQDPVNIKAAELMGRLHDKLEAIGYTGHALELYLVRLLFCLFADDTTIFEKDIFREFIIKRTSPDGSDLAGRLAEIFQVLNTPPANRFKNLDEDLAVFPYVNGKLFEEALPFASFDAQMRQALLDCCALDWGKISPAIFGSMFQSVMNPVERRNLGAHYTSEKNILKLIKPLFLDELWQEFENVKGSKPKLTQFHKKLSTLKFLDPACGCGNFLVVTYRELRMLEVEVLRNLYKGTYVTGVENVMWLNVDQFYGIEYEEFPAQIAQVAMWLMDHQMNMRISQEFGEYVVRLPLTKSATIVHGNALRIPWESVVPKTELSYILGNPPFIGKKEQTVEQKADMAFLFGKVKGAGVLDYVSGWYMLASRYIQITTIKVAFVSTNSITQGEQVGLLWSELFVHHKIKIHFAHRTFSWSNEARGNAAVHVVIIGFASFNTVTKTLFEYEDARSEPNKVVVKNINPFLVEGSDITVANRKEPICSVPEMNYGSMPIDNGNLILSDEEYEEIVQHEPNLTPYLRPYFGGEEFINAKKRWCIWLVGADPKVVKQSQFLMDRINRNKHFRLGSNREATKKLALNPGLFGEIRQPNGNYIIVPKVSSENRTYIPIGIFNSHNITSGSALIIPKSGLYEFGIIQSRMHITWTKYTCGRMKSDFQYSASIVYNNFPWPENPSPKQKEAIKQAAQGVLDARAQYPTSSLADLYDPRTMPPVLVKAHQKLDKAVDLAYRPQPFTTEAKRMEFLFELYEKYTAGLFANQKTKKK